MSRASRPNAEITAKRIIAVANRDVVFFMAPDLLDWDGNCWFAEAGLYIRKTRSESSEPNESRVFEILLASLPRADYLPKDARGRCARSVSYAHGFPERRRALPRQQPGIWRSRIKRAERCVGSLPRTPRTRFCLDGLRREWRGGNLRHLLCDLHVDGFNCRKTRRCFGEERSSWSGGRFQDARTVEGAAEKRVSDTDRRRRASRKPASTPLL